MGITSATHSEDGVDISPKTRDDWLDWVSGTATWNFALGDPLLDWMNLYAQQAGFKRDHEYATYDERTDFTKLIFEQARQFEAAVVSYLQRLETVEQIARAPKDSRDVAKVEGTFAAMQEGLPIIHQGVLWDAKHRTYGRPDLLIRSDVLLKLVPDAMLMAESTLGAPDIGGKWHYRVVDIKFATIHLSAKDELGNSDASPAYKLQLHIYNRALGRLQGYEPPVSYLLGRGWEQEGKRGTSCFERLGPVQQNGTLSQKRPIASELEAATEWVRRVRRTGHTWRVLPTPAVPELYPTMTNQEDSPWHNAKREIADALNELTLLWHVGVPGRQHAHRAGVFRWTDPTCTATAVQVTGPKLAPTLQSILDINQSTEGPPVHPTYVRTAEGRWRSPAKVEFYVDFETVTDLADDFSAIPERGGQPLIFIVGCGHLEGGQWRFRQFVAEDLTEPSEARAISDWVAHMDTIARQAGATIPQAVIFHWSHHEASTFETAYNSVKVRQPCHAWPTLPLFDFLKEVVRKEPLVVRGALAFGVKAIGKALYRHGLIATHWEDGPTDGLGAMVGAWRCYQEAKRKSAPVTSFDLMQQIMRYNEVDCRVIMEIVEYLRHGSARQISKSRA